MLTTHQLHINGRHHNLLPATTIAANRSEVLLIQADGQERRTALALALTGRMKPTSGTVSIGHDASLGSLRRRSAIIDSPDVNAPENHLTVKSLASEDLALVPFKFRDRTRPTAWLVKNGFRDILEQWIEELAPARLLKLQLELALANRDVDLVVVDSPDRHTADTGAWLPLLEELASGTMGRVPDANAETPLRPLVVVGIVGRLPDEWDGAAAVAGNDLLLQYPDDVVPPVETPAATDAVVESADDAPDPEPDPEPDVLAASETSAPEAATEPEEEIR
ncbi:ABC transporter ATP-binding protein [Arthrobacter psychrolactophilus]